MSKENEIIVYDNKAMIDIADNYLNEEVKGLALPQNYDYKGAVSSLYLQCCSLRTSDGQLALEVCSRDSIKKTVQDMLIKGLNPNKKQCYPIAYAVKDKETKEILGWELQLQESYFGKKKQAYTNNKELAKNGINAQCIYKGDVFETKIDKYGRKHVVKHEQKFENIKDMNIIGVYAVARFKDGTDMVDVMTVEELRKSWAMSKNYGTVHQNFTHEMACKTVSARLAKQLSNSTDDETIVNSNEEDNSEELVITPDEITEYSSPEVVVSQNEEVTETNSEQNENSSELVLETEETNEEPKKDKNICSKCEKPITQKVYDFSTSKFGKALCMSCQKEEV